MNYLEVRLNFGNEVKEFKNRLECLIRSFWLEQQLDLNFESVDVTALLIFQNPFPSTALAYIRHEWSCRGKLGVAKSTFLQF